VLGTSACGDDHGDEHDEENNAHGEHEGGVVWPEHACEHAHGGPYVPESGSLQAATDTSGDLPVVHHAEWTTIQLSDTDQDGTYEGFVNFEATEAADHRFFTSVKWPGEDAKTTSDPYLTISNADGGAGPEFKAKHPVGDDPGCVEVNFNHFYHEFSADVMYTVEISGHPQEMLSLVVVPANLEADDDH
jgi:hypothetical protein